MTLALDRTSIETYSGRMLDFLDPRPSQIAVGDIARGLAQTCRFAGQTSRWYSVAEHAVRVAELVPDELKLAALHHDSHEAYLGDWPTPLKIAVGAEVFDDLSHRLDVAIARKFDIASHHRFKSPTIKRADAEMLAREGVTFKRAYWQEHCPEAAPLENAGWSITRAEGEFLEAHATYAS